MKTVTIPFDLEMAKKIQSGEVEKKPEHEFKPFDHVLVRDDDEQHWICDFFSNVEEDRTFCCVGGTWHQCIPYEGNEHLVGKQATPEEHED